MLVELGAMDREEPLLRSHSGERSVGMSGSLRARSREGPPPAAAMAARSPSQDAPQRAGPAAGSGSGARAAAGSPEEELDDYNAAGDDDAEAGAAVGPAWSTTVGAEVAATWTLRCVLLVAAVLRASAVSSCYMLGFVVSLSFAPTVSSPLLRRGRVTRARVWLSQTIILVSAACVLVDVLYQVLVAWLGPDAVGDVSVWRVWGVVSYAATPVGAVGLLSDVGVLCAAAAHALVVRRQSRGDAADNIAGTVAPASAHLTGPLTTVAMIVSLTLAACVQPTSFGLALFGMYVGALLAWALGPNPGGKFSEPSFFSTGPWFRRIMHAVACAVVLGGSLFQLTPLSWDTAGFYLGFVRLPGHAAAWSYYVLYVGVVVLLACTASLEQDVARDGGGGPSAELREPLMDAVAVEAGVQPRSDTASTDARSGADVWTRLSGFMTRKVLHMFSGPLGVFLVGLSSLAWATTYPSVLALPVLLWPIAMLHAYSPGVDYRVPSRAVRMLLLYMTTLTLVRAGYQRACALASMRARTRQMQHVLYIYTNFAYASELLTALQSSGVWLRASVRCSASKRYRVIVCALPVDWYDDGYGSEAVSAGFPTAWRYVLCFVTGIVLKCGIIKRCTCRLLGLRPITRPVRRLGLQIGLMWVTAVYYKATRSPRAAPDLSGRSDSTTGDGSHRAGHITSRFIDGVTMSLTVLAYDFAWVWALIVLYVMGLSRVDGLHAGFMLFLLCFFVSPRLRERHWNKLVWYTELNLVLLFVLFVLGTTIPWDASGWPTTVGFVLDTGGGELRSSSYLSDVAIYVFSGLQYVHYQRRAATDLKRALYEKFRGIESLTNRLVRLQVEYGVWVCYGVFLLIALVPPVEWRKAVSIVLVLIIMQSHFAVGVSAGAAAPVVARLLAAFGIFEACVAAARYMYQFDAISSLFSITIFETSLSLESIGIRRVAADTSLYSYMLDSIVMVVLSSFQVRTMIRSAETLRLHLADTRPWQRDIATFEEWTRGDHGVLVTVSRGLLWTFGRLEFIWRYTMFHNSAKITLVLGFVAGCVHASVSGAMYVVIAVLYALRPVFSGTRCFPLRLFAADAGVRQPYETCWFPFQVLASGFLVAKYGFQLPAFASAAGRWYGGGTLLAQWWGMWRVSEFVTVSGDLHGPQPPIMSYHTAPVTFYGLFALLAPELAILLSVAVQRWAHSFKARLQHEARSRRSLASPRMGVSEAMEAGEDVTTTEALHATPLAGSPAGRPGADAQGSAPRVAGIIEEFYRGFRRYKSVVVLDVAIFLFTVTACVHVDVWSVAQLVGVALFVLPAYSRRMERRRWWTPVAFCQAVITLGKYAALTDFPPGNGVDTARLPFAWAAPYKYYFGFGPGATTWQLVSDFVTLLACGIVAHTWGSNFRRVQELRAGHMIIGDDGMTSDNAGWQYAETPRDFRDVFELSESDEDDGPVGVRRRSKWCGLKCCIEKVRVRSRGIKPMDAGDFSYDEDGRRLTLFHSVQFAVFTLSIKVVLIVVFALVAFQQDADIFSAGYLVFATYYLLASDKLVVDGNSMLHYLRVYNFGILVLQLAFQCPWIAGSQCGDANPGTCLSVLQLFGLRKYATVTVSGAAPCGGGGAGSNVDCPSPFSMRQGMVPTLLIFVLVWFALVRSLCSCVASGDEWSLLAMV